MVFVVHTVKDVLVDLIFKPGNFIRLVLQFLASVVKIFNCAVLLLKLRLRCVQIVFTLLSEE